MMAYCEIKSPLAYTTQIERWTKRTKDNGEEMAVPIEQLLNNTYYNKQTLERHELPIEVSLPANGWSSTVPYSQRIAVTGIQESDNPIVSPCTPKNLAPATVKIYRKMAAMVTDGETEDGYVTFYCGEKKPTADFKVYLRGVSANG